MRLPATAQPGRLQRYSVPVERDLRLLGEFTQGNRGRGAVCNVGIRLSRTFIGTVFVGFGDVVQRLGLIKTNEKMIQK